MNYHADITESLHYIKQGVKELSLTPKSWEGYFKVINTIVLSEIEEKKWSDFSLQRTSLAEISFTQIDILVNYGAHEQKIQYSDTILNAMQIAAAYWNPQFLSLYLNNFHLYCSGKQLLEGNFVVAQCKYDAAERLSTLAWYYTNRPSFWDPYRLPAFCNNMSVSKFEISDLGEAEATEAVKLAEKLGSKTELFSAKHFLAKIYITKKIRKEETRTLLEECIRLCENFDNSGMLGVSYVYLGFFELRWGRYSNADQALRRAYTILGKDAPVRARFELLAGFIELYRAAKDAESVGQYYEELVELVKNDDTVSDHDWQVLLGYAIWLVEQKEYSRAAHLVWEAVDNIKDILYTNTLLKYDPCGPWECIGNVLATINDALPDQRAKNEERFRKLLDEIAAIFPEMTWTGSQPDTLPTYSYPSVFAINGTS